jgi:hypothetical protein
MPETQTQIGAFSGSPQSVAAVVDAMAKFNGKGRKLQKVPKIITKISDENKVYIFNVGPWKQNQSMGSLGTYYIPACEEGKQHSKALAIDGLVIEHYPLREGTLDVLMDEEGSTGWEVAHQIIGVGKMLHPGNSLLRYGVFVSKTNPPSKEDVAKAREELYRHCTSLVNEANQSITEGTSKDTIRPEQHFVAARILNKTVAECPWLSRDVQKADRATCPGCGTVYTVGVIKCRECSYVLDKAKHDKAVAEGRY